MKIAFAGLSCVVPDDWRDESSITYTMPPDAQLVPALHASARPQSQANVVINWQVTDEQASHYLDKRLRDLQRGLPGFRLIERGDDGSPDDPIPFVVYSFAVQVPLMQVLRCRRIIDRIVCVTGTATPSAFERCRDVFRAAVESLARA